LTINLRGDPQVSPACKLGTPVQSQLGQLHFPSIGLTIDTSKAAEWKTPPKPFTILSAEEREAQLVSLAKQVLTTRKGDGICALLAVILDLPFDSRNYNHLDSNTISGIRCLQQAVISYQSVQVISALEPFLGCGPGLTPSGDDMVIGFILTLNHWGDLLKPELEIEELNRAVVQMAYSRTTTLSANLIECATLCQADERLTTALNCLLIGQLDPEACAANLLTWGNSSGCDALIGMALAII
jgi:hypothetical protein